MCDAHAVVMLSELFIFDCRSVCLLLSGKNGFVVFVELCMVRMIAISAITKMCMRYVLASSCYVIYNKQGEEKNFVRVLAMKIDARAAAIRKTLTAPPPVCERGH